VSEETKVETDAIIASTANKVAITADKTSDAIGLHAAGQRKTNLIWERTQSVIALSIVLTTCAGIAALGLVHFWHEGVTRDAIPSFPPEWWTVVGLVIGFYFGRQRNDLAIHKV
jgi:hypothetical protein